MHVCVQVQRSQEDLGCLLAPFFLLPKNLSLKWNHPFGWTGQLACSWDLSILTLNAVITDMGSYAKHFLLCGCWGLKLMS